MGVGPVTRRAVFLDRDGVLNRTGVRDGVPHPPATAGELEVLPGVPEALALLGAEGLLRIVVTNQPDVARRTQTREAVEAINDRLRQDLPLEAIYTCYHQDADGCDCRKPRPGLITRAGAAFGIDLGASFMVGDRWSDIVAGQAAGCTTFLLDVPYSQPQRCRPDFHVPDLLHAARTIVALVRPGTGDN
jgi:D-glycero-D-manno-heptose 1,7-bisphosphate phosphatase